MKKKIFYLIFILAFNGISYAQLPLTYGVRKTMDLYETNKLTSGDGTHVLTENEIDGSPFLQDEFVSGSIYTAQKIHYIEVPLRYNIYNDNLEFKLPSDEIQALSAPEIVEKAIIGNIQLNYSPFLRANKIRHGFLILLEEGKASLYSKPVVAFKEATEPAAYKPAEPAKFVRKADEFYIRIGTEPAKLITSKKDLVESFQENKEKLDDYIEKNRIKTNKSEDLRKVVVFYNSM